MPSPIRLGFVGANVASSWSSISHFPAVQASADVEMTAVCTTRAESAEAARQAFGARLAFTDYRAMAASPEIDAVVVSVRVPSHYGPTRAAIEAGKHVYTEWPLGRTTAEAEELAALARARGVQTAIGLQSRVSPVLLYVKELLETGYVGQVLACNVATMRDGALARPAGATWMADVTQGVSTLTIGNGHVIDALQFVAGRFTTLSCLLATQVKEWIEIGTGRTVDVSSPDNVLVSGQLAGGAVASVHVGGVPWASCGYRMEIYGTEGTLVVTGSVSSQRGMLRLQGARQSKELHDLEVPPRFVRVPADFPKGDPYNIGQMYAVFAEAIRTGSAPAELPNFDHAVELHRFLDTMRLAHESGRTVAVP